MTKTLVYADSEAEAFAADPCPETENKWGRIGSCLEELPLGQVVPRPVGDMLVRVRDKDVIYATSVLGPHKTAQLALESDDAQVGW